MSVCNLHTKTNRIYITKQTKKNGIKQQQKHFVVIYNMLVRQNEKQRQSRWQQGHHRHTHTHTHTI